MSFGCNGSGRCVRWAKREQFHLTLKFLGNVESRRLEALTASIRGACAGLGVLQLRAGRIGFFPDARRPRVIWTSVLDGRGWHCQLVEGSALLPREIDAPDRSQQAHVTASHSTNARVRSRRW